ncbi:putative inner membrane protein [Escherichia coli]|nr:putative inner membrane protein [Escherichia coli]
MSEMYSFTGMPAGYFSAVFLTGYLTGMGYIFLPKFTQTGQQRYAHGEAIVNYLARKEAATHSGRRRKGEARKLDYALLGWAVSANLGREWAARITPSLTAAVRAPEIARSGVLFSLQMHLSLGPIPVCWGEVIPWWCWRRCGWRRRWWAGNKADVNRNKL